ncbi:MAG: DapH/DapD/GlmU-related protein [bacterium]
MIERNPNEELPAIHKTAYVHPTAVIIGQVHIGKRVFIGPGSVIRADEPGSSIIIHDNCNVQDRVVIHALEKTSVIVEESSSLSHGCIIHGPCKIGRNCFVGFGSVVFKAEIDEGTVIKHLTVVEGIKISSNKLVANGTVIDSEDMIKQLAPATEKLKTFSQKVVKTNLDLIMAYKKEEIAGKAGGEK